MGSSQGQWEMLLYDDYQSFGKFQRSLIGAQLLPVKTLVAHIFHHLNSYFYRRCTDRFEYTAALKTTYETMIINAAEARSMNINKFGMT